jgi:hypothetical protein
MRAPPTIKYQGQLYRAAEAAPGSLSELTHNFLLGIAKAIKRQVGASLHPNIEVVAYARNVQLEGWRRKWTWHGEVTVHSSDTLYVRVYDSTGASNIVYVKNSEAPAAAIAKAVQFLQQRSGGTEAGG